MGKFLGIDYGKKRIGLSITDDNKIISSPLDTVSTVDIFNFLDNFLQKEDIELIIIGMPKRLNNTDNLISKEIHIFSKKITKKFQIPIRFVDERYTSKIASTIIINSHLNVFLSQKIRQLREKNFLRPPDNPQRVNQPVLNKKTRSRNTIAKSTRPACKYPYSISLP